MQSQTIQKGKKYPQPSNRLVSCVQGLLFVGGTQPIYLFPSKGPMSFSTFKGSVNGEITRLKMWWKMVVYLLCISIDEMFL